MCVGQSTQSQKQTTLKEMQTNRKQIHFIYGTNAVDSRFDHARIQSLTPATQEKEDENENNGNRSQTKYQALISMLLQPMHKYTNENHKRINSFIQYSTIGNLDLYSKCSSYRQANSCCFNALSNKMILN